MTVTGQGQFNLVPDSAVVSECNQIGFNEDEAFELGLRRSVAFSNYVNLSTEQTEGRIRYEIVSLGNTEPLIAYPAMSTGILAGDWNDVAAANNRVVVSLYPDAL